MYRNHHVRSLWLGLGLVGLLATLAEAAPWEQLLTHKPVDCDPNKDYTVGEDNGPWMIMASGFSGDGAEQQAKELVLELRKKYKLPAYLYHKKFDYSGTTMGKGLDKYGNPVKMRHLRSREVDEIAVLVGDYASDDDPQAQDTLRKLKYNCTPDCLRTDGDRQTNADLAGFRSAMQQLLPKESSKRQRGPLGNAFLTKNPLLPEDYFVPKGLDPLVVKANEGVDHCLLDCPGKYTVQVAHFTGETFIDQAKVAAIESGRETYKSSLAEAADKAHRLTLALRSKGYEAYEFHDRCASVVTVGSFNSPGTPRDDGQIEINPQIQKIIETFRARPQNVPGRPPGTLVPRTLVNIPFDIQPMPVEVPRRSVSAILARTSTDLPKR